ncbi:hypothetical protein [Paenibacillus filicis]|uniref:hypothetical protein n=1 Tax=Paenibacillus filicis TaxID=669464 RepID=UPI003119FD36
MRTEDGGVTWKKQTLESPVDPNKTIADTEIFSRNMLFFNVRESYNSDIKLRLVIGHG